MSLTDRFMRDVDAAGLLYAYVGLPAILKQKVSRMFAHAEAAEHAMEMTRYKQAVRPMRKSFVYHRHLAGEDGSDGVLPHDIARLLADESDYNPFVYLERKIRGLPQAERTARIVHENSLAFQKRYWHKTAMKFAFDMASADALMHLCFDQSDRLDARARAAGQERGRARDEDDDDDDGSFDG